MTDSGRSEPATDLFDRWLAHREGRAPEAAPDLVVPEPTPDPEPEEPAQPAPEPQVQPPIAPEPGFPPLPTQRYDAAEATGQHRPTHLAATEPAAKGLPDHRVAAASVLAALHAPAETRPVPEPAAVAEPAQLTEPAPAPAAAEPGRAVGVPERAALPHTIFFKPRTSGKLTLGLLLLVFLAATVIAAIWAWSDRTYLSYGITAVAGLVTAVVWAARASSTPTRLTLHGSELEIVRNGGRAQFDLASKHTPIEMHGEPGDRKWKVLFLRRSMSPYVVDASMVDPAEFTRVLRYFRPDAE